MKNNALIDVPKHDDLIYDVGMHRGEDAEFYLRKGFRCVAFEADPENIDFCKKKLAEFIGSGQLKIIEGAIIDAAGVLAGQKTVRFYKNDTYSVLGTIFRESAEQYRAPGTANPVVEVGVVNFEAAIRQHGIPHYMKIDIEGCDLVCVNTLQLFKNRPDYVSFEVDRGSFANNKNAIGLLAKLGYDCFQVVEQSEGVLAQIPPFPAREGKYTDQRSEKDSSGLFGAELAGEWKSKPEVLRICRVNHVINTLIGPKGKMAAWSFKGSRRLLSWARRFVKYSTSVPFCAWHDIHARQANEQKHRP